MEIPACWEMWLTRNNTLNGAAAIPPRSALCPTSGRAVSLADRMTFISLHWYALAIWRSQDYLGVIICPMQKPAPCMQRGSLCAEEYPVRRVIARQEFSRYAQQKDNGQFNQINGFIKTTLIQGNWPWMGCLAWPTTGSSYGHKYI